jgi:hypothetical protein
MTTITPETNARIDALEARLTELAQRVADLTAENQRLRSANSPDTAEAQAGTWAVSRRGLIAAAAVPAGALLMGRSGPAAAADGGNVIAGQETQATNTTRVVSSAGHGLDGVTNSAVDGRAGVEGKAAATTGVTYGVWGKSDSIAGTGVFGEARAGSGSTVGVKGVSYTTDDGIGVYGEAMSGSPGIYCYGVYGAANGGPGGTGIRGEAKHPSGATIGVDGEVDSPIGVAVWGSNRAAESGKAVAVQGDTEGPTGRGVYGFAKHNSGVNYGVYGETNSTSAGFALYGQGRFKATGRCFLGAPASAPPDATLTKGGISFYLNTSTNRLKIRVKYPDGTLKTGSIALT